MVTFNELLNARLGSLNDRVKDWTRTVDRLKKLEDQAANGLVKKAEKADWAGDNAGITLPFVRKTAKEFQDALREARSIRNILRDAHSEFKTAKAKLTEIVNAAPGQGIRIDANGTVSYLIHPDRRSKDSTSPEPSEADFEKARNDIKAALDKANEADEIASRALRTSVGKDKHNFSGTDYDSLKQAGRQGTGRPGRQGSRQDRRQGGRCLTRGDRPPEQVLQGQQGRPVLRRTLRHCGRSQGQPGVLGRHGRPE